MYMDYIWIVYGMLYKQIKHSNSTVATQPSKKGTLVEGFLIPLFHWRLCKKRI